MFRFDRYMLSQLMTLFGFFSLVLVAVYWVNRAVLLFNHLVGDGQSLLVFLEFTMLTLPNVIKIMMPVAAFAASVYVTNRLSTESELVVMQAVGLSSFRLARPVLLFGFIVALLVSLLAHVLVPASRTALAERTVAMSQNVTAQLLTEGKFLHPSDGVTLFIRKITARGEMEDLFLSDARTPDKRITYSARRALLVQVESGPKLVMFNGMAQTLELKGNRLFTTRFSEFTYDLNALMKAPGARKPSPAELSTARLLSAAPADLTLTGDSRADFLYEGNSRFADALTAIAAAMVGFSAMLLGGFSRFGKWRQIGIGVVLLVCLQLLVDWSAGMAVRDPRFWPTTYTPAAFGFAVSILMLWISERPVRRRIPSGGLAS